MRILVLGDEQNLVGLQQALHHDIRTFGRQVHEDVVVILAEFSEQWRDGAGPGGVRV